MPDKEIPMWAIEYGQHGITKRDWFATFAPEPANSLVIEQARKRFTGSDEDVKVKLRYEWADRMIKEGSK